MPETLNIAAGLQALAAKVEATKPNAGTENILFVDDNQIILDNSLEILADLGYKVKGALDAATAVQILVDGFKPDILCCDIVIPGGLNGVELSRKVAEIMPDIKVLLVTGYGANIMDGMVNQDGFRLLSKPYTADELGGRIRNILDNNL